MCLRWIPSKVAPSASSARRERSLSASVLSSTRRHSQRLESVAELEELRLDVRPAAPRVGMQPRPPDLDGPVLGAKREEAGRADDLPVEHRHERDLAPRVGLGERLLDPGAPLLRGPRLDDAEPAPGPWVAGRGPETGLVRPRQRLQPDDTALERRAAPPLHRPRQYTRLVPIYEYACMGCESHFEELVRSEGQAVTCPECGDRERPQAALHVRRARRCREVERLRALGRWLSGRRLLRRLLRLRTLIPRAQTSCPAHPGGRVD